MDHNLRNKHHARLKKTKWLKPETQVYNVGVRGHFLIYLKTIRLLSASRKVASWEWESEVLPERLHLSELEVAAWAGQKMYFIPWKRNLQSTLARQRERRIRRWRFNRSSVKLDLFWELKSLVVTLVCPASNVFAVSLFSMEYILYTIQC